ncbi:LPXTG cell wall anchor domain-containing protein [Enterococcus gallinarum]
MPTIKTQAKASRSVTTKKTLPQTGEETNSMVLYSGAALAVAAILGIFIKRSSRKTKE